MLEDDADPAGTPMEGALEEDESGEIKPGRALGASAGGYTASGMLYLENLRIAADVPEQEFYQTLREHPHQIQYYAIEAANQAADDPVTAAGIVTLGAFATAFTGLAMFAGKEGLKEGYSRIRNR